MFTYRSEGQPVTYGFLPEGVYPALVMKVEERVAKQSNNPMLVVTLKAMGPDGESSTVTEYLTSTAKSIWKIDRFMWAIGVCPAAGAMVTVVPQQVVGKRCYVRLGVEHGDQRDFNNCQEVLSLEEGQALVGGGVQPARPAARTTEECSGPGWRGNSYYPEEAARAAGKSAKQDEFENLEEADDIPF